MTWEVHGAKQFCESHGGHLVTVTSEYEDKLLKNMLTTGMKNSYWMGGYADSNRDWRWITGEDFLYTNWADRQPDNSRASGCENVLMMYKNIYLFNSIVI